VINFSGEVLHLKTTDDMTAIVVSAYLCNPNEFICSVTMNEDP